ncbi:MAG: alpha/beta hydrolase [Acidimicrobiia bacterium]|nr:alpha/beta hydrolase [Acidimicrobiia bacterium]MDH5236850.1 alpha/beta hydrolase [Acidimicrobiia bacterium]
MNDDTILDRIDDQHRAVLEAMPTMALAGEYEPDRRAEIIDMLAVQRASMQQLYAAADVLSDFPDVRCDDHVSTAADGHGVVVRTYRPAESTSATSPGFYYMHGGGMIMGSVAFSDDYCARLVRALGIVVASVEYRLAPEHPYPTPLEDCYTGLEWFFTNADHLGVDDANIAIGGGSAGGGLAAGLALLARDRGHLTPVFQLLTFPMIDDRNITPSSHAITHPKLLWNRERNLLGWNCYLAGGAGGADVPAYAAPARADDLTGLPPAFVPVGDLDLFLDENRAYVEALDRAGVTAQLKVYEGAFHGSQLLVPDSDQAKQWFADEAEALARGLGLDPPT